MKRIGIWLMCLFVSVVAAAQYNTDRLLTVGRSALYYEDYVLSIQYFNQAISAKPYLYDPWFFRALAKYYLDDYAGAESDCDEAIKRNPYVLNTYELRALLYIQQEKYERAVADYAKALSYAPYNKGMWHNRVICRMKMKDYDNALLDIDTIQRRWGNDAQSYAIRGEVLLNKEDTVGAIKAIEKSIDIDAYDPVSWAMLAQISLMQKRWENADSQLTKAIHLRNNNANFYVNRAIARVNCNKLQGAMADYDMTISIDPNNFLAHYNRGLLRATVGDDNRAIEDFNFVLGLEPDNILALYNRATLLENTGDYRGAIRDYSSVIEDFPNFWAGLLRRAACYRKIGQTSKADQDELTVMKAQIDKRTMGKQPKLDKEKLRKRSEIDLDKYNQLVIADETDSEQQYESQWRGKVQNRAVAAESMGLFELTFKNDIEEVQKYLPYAADIENLNAGIGKGEKLVRLTCTQKALEEDEARAIMKLADKLSDQIDELFKSNEESTSENRKSKAEKQNSLYLRRAIAYSTIQNREGAIDDLTLLIEQEPDNALAYWQRAVCKAKMNEFNRANRSLEDPSLRNPESSKSRIPESPIASPNDQQLSVREVMADLNEAIELSPSNQYLYYNRALQYAILKDTAKAIEDYDKAISLDPKLAEAYYNRGLLKLAADKRDEARADLSKAGELGLYKAYSIMKNK